MAGTPEPLPFDPFCPLTLAESVVVAALEFVAAENPDTAHPPWRVLCGRGASGGHADGVYTRVRAMRADYLLMAERAGWPLPDVAAHYQGLEDALLRAYHLSGGLKSLGMRHHRTWAQREVLKDVIGKAAETPGGAPFDPELGSMHAEEGRVQALWDGQGLDHPDSLMYGRILAHNRPILDQITEQVGRATRPLGPISGHIRLKFPDPMALAVTTTRSTGEEPSGRPIWNRQARQLTFRGQVVRDFSRRGAPNQEAILDRFQEAAWPRAVSEIKVSRDKEYSATLSGKQMVETVESLRKGVEGSGLVFNGDGTGRGVMWGTDDNL